MKNTFGKSIIPENESQRIQALYRYNIVDTPPEASFNNLCHIMADSFDVPIALISFVDKEAVFFKANVGIPGVTHTDRGVSFCAYAILSKDPTIIENAKKDPCFLANPLVHGSFGLRFYAAAPLITPEGLPIGTVCIVDKEERTLTKREENRLTRFAKAVMFELELRSKVQHRVKGMIEKEAQLKEALTIAKVGSWEYDIANQHTTWSDELYAIYGIEKQEPGSNATDLYTSMVPPEDLPDFYNKFQYPETIPDTSSFPMNCPDGTKIYIRQTTKKLYDQEGKLVKLYGISQDITERINYEKKLIQKDERFRSLVHNSSDLIAILNKQGQYNYVADSVTNILGYKPDYLSGRSIFEFVHPRDSVIVQEALESSEFNKYKTLPTVRFIGKAGNWVCLEVKIADLSEDSSINGLIINARDISERIVLEEQLKKEARQLQKKITTAVIQAQESERAQLGQELHDNVNQVLTTIKLYNELVIEDIGDSKELIAKSTHLIQDCINEIRSISKRLSAPSLGDIYLEDSIKELVESINLTNKLEIFYSVNGLEELPIAQETHLAIYRIIQEQLNNILKHAAASMVLITLSIIDNKILLSLVDNGQGFDTSMRGNGIGIMNMKTRAENLGGHFILESSPGHGCRLQVSFPLLPVE